MDLVLVVAGVGVLYLGGEGLVRGAAAVGRRFGLSPLFIGLTIVSCGTSSPELAASLAAVLRGAPGIAIGNVVGSNIANLGLVLGLTAAIWPLAAASRYLRRDLAVMLVVSLWAFWLVRDDRVGRLEGLALLAAMALYLVILLREREAKVVAAEYESAVAGPPGGIWASLALVAVGIVLLVAGARLLVGGAVGIARTLGVSERVIGLTAVAFGTSLPELASSVVAAIRHESDIVLGNLVGSNIFNLLFILGATAVVQPVTVPWLELRPDLLVMLGVSLVVALLLAIRRRLTRPEGAVLIVAYGLYVASLFR